MVALLVSHVVSGSPKLEQLMLWGVEILARQSMKYSKMVDELRRRAVHESLLLWLVRHLMAMQVTLH